MLLNLSNHPSKKWSKNQQKAAESEYKIVKDIPFPHISPEASMGEVNKIVTTYKNKILEYQPDAVHIMGELTFTCSLIDQLMKHKIKCIASTTTRNVEENGEGVKKVRFEFVRFREYKRI